MLVNNAGFGTVGALEAASDAVIRQQFEVNLFGLIEVTRAVLPGMRARRSGVIVNGLTESLQYELNPFGIRLKIVEPGGYRTNFAGRSMDFYGVGEVVGYKAPFEKFIAAVEHWPMSENIGEVADVIFEAATDGSEKLRYPVGHEAGPLLETRVKTVGYFASQLHLSTSYLSDLLQRFTGKSTVEHIQLELVEKAKNLLWGTENSISEIAYELGFEHPSHFTKVFKAKTGKSPKEYRHGN